MKPYVIDVARETPATLALPEPWRSTHLTVVIPTFNEAATLPATTRSVLALPLPNLRLIVVDDSSPDGTGERAEELARETATDGRARMRVLHQPPKSGLGRAYVTGMSAALADGVEFVAQMDADGSHPAEYLPRMLGVALAADAGLVIGSRYVAGGRLSGTWGTHRRLLSRWANCYVGGLLALRLRDVTSGFNLWRRDTLLDIGPDRLTTTGYAFQVETKYLARRRGHRAIEVPIFFDDRRGGTSKMTLATQVESALLPFRLHRRHAADPPACVSGAARPAG